MKDNFCRVKVIIRYGVVLAMAVMALCAVGQDTAPIELHLDRPVLPESLLKPMLPQPIAPGVTLSFALPPEPNADITGWRSHGARQAVMSFTAEHAELYPLSREPFRFRMDPYSGNWATSGVITGIGRGYLSGSGSFTSRPALGNVGSASVAITQFLGDNVTVTAGVGGNKYHFGRDVWNSYGVWGQASWRLSDVFTLNAFGQYCANQQFHSVAAMPFLQDTRYGGTLGIKMSDHFSLDVGAQRYYDVYTGKWRTVPVVAPTLNVMGQPISIDAGGLLYQLFESILGKGRNGYTDYGDYRPTDHPYNVPMPAGFNPNSPVRIPDALR